jgi:hypothetical protein
MLRNPLNVPAWRFPLVTEKKGEAIDSGSDFGSYFSEDDAIEAFRFGFADQKSFSLHKSRRRCLGFSNSSLLHCSWSNDRQDNPFASTISVSFSEWRFL